METLTRKQAINILRSNKWKYCGCETVSQDDIWSIFYDGVLVEPTLYFKYKGVSVGDFRLKTTGWFIFKKLAPDDELYIEYLAVLTEIEQEKDDQRIAKRNQMLKEIEQTYFR